MSAPTKSEGSQLEPIMSEPILSEPVHANPSESEPSKSELDHSEPAKSESTKPMPTYRWRPVVPGEHNCWDSTSASPADPATCFEGCPLEGQGTLLPIYEIKHQTFPYNDRLTLLIADHDKDWGEKFMCSHGHSHIPEKYRFPMTVEEAMGKYQWKVEKGLEPQSKTAPHQYRWRPNWAEGEHHCWDSTSAPLEDPKICFKGCPLEGQGVLPPKKLKNEGRDNYGYRYTKLISEFGEKWRDRFRGSDGCLTVPKEYKWVMTVEELQGRHMWNIEHGLSILTATFRRNPKVKKAVKSEFNIQHDTPDIQQSSTSSTDPKLESKLGSMMEPAEQSSTEKPKYITRAPWPPSPSET